MKVVSTVDTVKLPIGHEEGYRAPEISLQDVNGKMLSLSSLRGKYVLIDFWASWCAPCRNEMPSVVKLYADYKDQNFEIFGVSLDTKKENWVKAIMDDHITWLQVSELKSWQSQAVRDYGIDAIPATCIIDPKGMIIAKNLHGDELKQFMKKLFNK
ncbi:TlpA family protein disulfide reductase [Solitalea koreensis]|nr:TlpA disulfide reductase family protein [Solitalea koreensis]